MQNKYYYLVSSLPLLQFDEKPGILKKEFLSECGKWLSLPEFNILKRVDIDSSNIPSNNKLILRQWKEFDSFLRDDLSKARQITQGMIDERLPASMLSVFDKETPFLMEKELARKQWVMLDELESGNYFDMNILIIYFLKLQILERFAAFDKDEGARVFESTCEVTI
jgi:hypothetical protein